MFECVDMYVYTHTHMCIYTHIQEVKEAEDALAQAQRRLVRGHERFKVAQRLTAYAYTHVHAYTGAQRGRGCPCASTDDLCVGMKNLR